MEAAVWGFIGTLIGALASLGGTWLTNRDARLLRKTELELEKYEKFCIFQREALISLQDALHDLLRLIARGYHEDTQSFRETGEWRKNYLSDDVSSGQMNARRHLLLLVERVADDQLRSRVKQLNSKLTEMSLVKSRELAGRQWDEASAEGFDTLEHIGKVLRAQY